MFQTLNAAIAVVGIDVSKNFFHIMGHDERGAMYCVRSGRLARLRPALSTYRRAALFVGSLYVIVLSLMVLIVTR
jgi:hypothetical protein